VVGRDFGEIQVKNASIKAATSLLVPMLVLVRALKGGEVCKLSDNKRARVHAKITRTSHLQMRWWTPQIA